MDPIATGPDAASFQAFAKRGHNLIPVWMELQAGLDSPLSLYSSLVQDGGANSILLESATTDSGNGRYSIICPSARYRLEVRGQRVLVRDFADPRGERISEKGQEEDPVAWIKSFHQRFDVAEAALPPGARSWGGLYGYFGYDTVRHLEPVLKAGRDGKAPALTDIPDICLLLCHETVVLDHKLGRIFLTVYADPEITDWQAAHDRLRELARRIESGAAPEALIPAAQDDSDISMHYHFPRPEHAAAVERIRAYTRAGDCMQVVLGGVFTAPLEVEPLLLYRSLRAVSESPYMYFVDGGDFQIAGSSPEELVRLDGERILLRPIAGTRRRGRDGNEDRALEREMLDDPKEIAEHLMLVDLGRNDIGRVAEVGSVSVSEYLSVRRYRQVMHLVSTVTARLRQGLDAFDLLRATFPAGTLSGAPKVRAMQIIDELEPVGRGLYGGGVGCINYDGNLNLAIAIRTAVIQNGRVHVGAGGGIVADSQPELEWREAHNKALSIARALVRVQGRVRGPGQEPGPGPGKGRQES